MKPERVRVDEIQKATWNHISHSYHRRILSNRGTRDRVREPGSLDEEGRH